MSILQLFLSVISVLTIFYLFFKPKIGILLYLIYCYLAPHLIIGNYILGTRTESILFLAVFFLKIFKKIPKDKLRPLKSFLLFYGLQLFVIPFSFDVQFSFNVWMLQTSRLAYSLLLLSAVSLYDNKERQIYARTFLAVFIVMIVYGLFLTSIAGLNPYLMLREPIFGGEFNEVYASGNGGSSGNTNLAEGRLFGRISSFFSDPQEYAIALGFFLIFIFRFVKRKALLVLLCVMTGVAIVTSGIRTPIAAVVMTILFVLLYFHKFNYFVYAAVFAVMLFLVVPLIFPQAAEYVTSIIHSNDNDIGGSSLEMRIDQFEACIQIMFDNPICGHGIGWTYWYLDKYGPHPTALCFESILFSVMCEMGIAGFIIWTVFGISYIKTVKLYARKKSQAVLLYSLLCYYLFYTGITGDYGYIPQLLIVYVIMIGTPQGNPKDVNIMLSKTK